MFKNFVNSISIFIILFCSLLSANEPFSSSLLCENEKYQAIASIMDDIQNQLALIEELIIEAPQNIETNKWSEHSIDQHLGKILSSDNDFNRHYQKAIEDYSDAHINFVSGDLATAQDRLKESYSSLKCLQDLSADYNEFENDPNISQAEKDRVRPYLLPSNHPLKDVLDCIFSQNRPLFNPQTFASAGFISKFIQPRSFIRVASHYQAPGYLFKVYLDSELRIKRGIPGWKWFSFRVKNARAIDQFIKDHGIKHFTVPQKWIYPTPLINRSLIPEDRKYTIKNEILVVEDMELVPKAENILAWKKVITEEHLDEFLAIIKHVGGSSYRADNVAFTKNGKFAFIDTEYTVTRPDLNSIIPYLSPQMAAYWKKIAKKKKG